MSRRETEANNEFGRQLEKERQNRNLTKEAWAAMLGVRKPAYLNWLTGGEPHPDNIRQVARVLGITSLEVFAWILDDGDANERKGVSRSSFALVPLAA